MKRSHRMIRLLRAQHCLAWTRNSTLPTSLRGHIRCGVHRPHKFAILKPVTLGASLLIASLSVSAQTQTQPEPGLVPGATPETLGTIGLDGTVDKFYSVSHSAIIKAAGGVRHLVHLDHRTVVHGARSAGDETFGGLEEGSQVVVHCVVEGDKNTALEIDRVGDGGLSHVEGTVQRVDRAAKTLTIQLADASTVTLRLTDRAAKHVGKDIGSTDRVIVYYAGESGDRVAHYFKRVK
jgi:hypothetical protein